MSIRRVTAAVFVLTDVPPGHRGVPTAVNAFVRLLADAAPELDVIDHGAEGAFALRTLFVPAWLATLLKLPDVYSNTVVGTDRKAHSMAQALVVVVRDPEQLAALEAFMRLAPPYSTLPYLMELGRQVPRPTP